MRGRKIKEKRGVEGRGTLLNRRVMEGPPKRVMLEQQHAEDERGIHVNIMKKNRPGNKAACAKVLRCKNGWVLKGRARTPGCLAEHEHRGEEEVRSES